MLYFIYCNVELKKSLSVSRGYCSRRLRRLRKTLGFKMGNRHKFVGKKVTVEMLSDNRLDLDNFNWSFTCSKLAAGLGTFTLRKFQFETLKQITLL